MYNPLDSSQKKNQAYHKLKVFKRYGFQRFFGEVIVPILLMVLIPFITIALWHICRYYKGNLIELYNYNPSGNIIAEMIEYNVWRGSLFPIFVIFGYLIYAVTMTIILPGELYSGPVTDKGNTPVYKNNGMLFFIVTLIIFIIGSGVLEYFGYSVTVICDRYGEFLFLFNIIGLVFCLFLYVKGMFFPSSSDNGASGNPIFDYYWGVELYPRIGGVDVKLITNCRWGMMVWSLAVMLFWFKSLKVYGFVDSHFVTMILIELYLAKFFHWESGYMKTIDICVDRAGFYLCYGCFCFVPLFYVLPSIYLAYHPVYLGYILTIIVLLLGMLCLFINYDADRQRFEVRSTDGNCLVWGKEPVIIRAKYILLNGEQKENILLASGYWGISRHFHYLPELGLAFCWCTTAMFHGLIPYLYFIYLSILLVHRSMRDDTKCFNKYGDYWLQYRELVPYKIVPCLF